MVRKRLYDNFFVILFLIAGLMVMGIAIYTGAFIFSLSSLDIPEEQSSFINNRIAILSFIIFISTALLIISGILNFTFNKRKQSAFLAQARQQELMSTLSRSFISSGETPSLIKNAMRMTGEFLKVDRIIIGISDADSETSRIVYSWHRSGEFAGANEVKGLNDPLNSTFPMEQPEEIHAFCCNDISREKRFYTLGAMGVKAFIWAPLYVERRFWAVLSLEEFKPRVWTRSDRALIGTVSSVIAGAVERDLRENERDSARQLAERESKAKGDFLANMSHEMRTPMNAIIGMTAIAKNSYDLEKKEYCLNRIENASTHLLGVINDILDMSKIEANKFELSPSEFNFEKLLQRVVSVINFKVEEKNQDFTVNIDRKIPHILNGDEQRLAQVITNLLSNAVKFTREGGKISLNAELEHKDGDICTVKISVADSGIGISREQQSKLFSSFVQADSATSRKFGGTGLGLAISKRIVEMMDGDIRVESEMGKGATFTFTVKMEEVADLLEELHGPMDWSNTRVLVVDDDPHTGEYFCDLAGRLGFSCDTAVSGEEALQLLPMKGFYDIYFIDWKMPGIDGIELTRKIRKMYPSGKDVKKPTVIIITSAVDWHSIESEAETAGVSTFLNKPLFPSSIADIISRYLGVKDQVGEAPETLSDVHLSGKRLLLAEDVDINREIVISLLEPTGITIDCAENGAIALKLFTEAPDSYDMIFMDVQMPEMDGYEATRRIRAFEAQQENNNRLSFAEGEKHIEENSLTKEKSLEFAKQTPRLLERPKGVPIIAMTANVFKEDVEQCFAVGMDAHVGKPLNIKEVIDILQEYLK